ncbi:hypothetical protein E4U55_004592 [Claviceps digitariae]|nr:hypothetical protein E4U55_004592 [Claviceps digitariae]
MLSIRSIARSAPRAAARLTTASMVRSGVARPSSTFVKATALSSLPSSTGGAHFSTTVGRRAAKATGIDSELSEKLGSEITIEQEMREQEPRPASIKDFLQNSPFELVDVPGRQTVKLVRSYKNEKITVSFSIADINFNPYPEDAELDEEEFDEELQPPKKENSSPAEEEDMDELEDDHDEESGPPLNLTILVEKPGKTEQVLTIEATAQLGHISIDNMSLFDNANLAMADGFDASQKPAEDYNGPSFHTLDDDLQMLTERYLEERGITQALAVFAYDFMDVKEQSEYLRWLKRVKAFVDV